MNIITDELFWDFAIDLTYISQQLQNYDITTRKSYQKPCMQQKLQVIREWPTSKTLKNKKEKCFGKLYDAVFRENFWQKRPAKELYKHTEIITTLIRKRRMSFFSHIARMNDKRLTNRIFNIISTSKMGNSWYRETIEDLQKLFITKEDIQNRKICREKIKIGILISQSQPKRSRRKWTDEER